MFVIKAILIITVKNMVGRERFERSTIGLKVS